MHSKTNYLLRRSWSSSIAKKPVTNILRRNADQTALYAHPERENMAGYSQMANMNIVIAIRKSE